MKLMHDRRVELFHYRKVKESKLHPSDPSWYSIRKSSNRSYEMYPRCPI